MKRLAAVLAVILVVALVVAVQPVEAAKKIKERKGQIIQTFTNNSGQQAYGLVVTLNSGAIVVKGDDNRAGPFGNASGDDTSKITMSNPETPIEVSGTVELTFRSYSSNLKISKWWWTNAAGKRIGEKNKG
jgi:beta-lactam-binding protein with PASTA domain